nr:F-box/kelch-repeat protein SKIP6 [Ipomoea batatas]
MLVSGDFDSKLLGSFLAEEAMAEVFDQVSGSWSALPSQIEVRDKWMHASTVMDRMVECMQWRIGAGWCTMWGTVPKRLDLGCCIVMIIWAKLGDDMI